jgi:hypothetical protein
VRFVVGDFLAIASVVLVVLVLAIGLPLWGWSIAPWWEAQPLYAAAEEARSRPYVDDAEVYLDSLDGNFLSVYLTPDATAADARELWCEVLLGAEGGWIEVSQGYDGEFGAPKRKECTALEPTP